MPVNTPDPEPSLINPPRVLMRAGEWVVPVWDRPPDWKKRMEPIDASPPPKEIAPTTNRRDTLRAERRPSRYKPSGRGPGRPRVHPPKDPKAPDRRCGRLAWNHKPIEDQKIEEMRERGLSYAAIGAALNIHPSTVYKRMSEAAKRQQKVGA